MPQMELTMDENNINGMLRVLRPLLKDTSAAKGRLEQYWSDKIAIVWEVRQIHRAANENEIALTNEEAERVLRQLFNHHNAQFGLKWEDLTNYIEDHVLGRKMSKRELNRFIHNDIIAIRKSTKRRKRP